MCGICGTYQPRSSPDDVNKRVCAMLRQLRHRGYDSWGVARSSNDSIVVQRSVGGLPPDAISATVPSDPERFFAIGHTRYTTRGSHESTSQAQPLVNQTSTMALVHNGQVRCPDLERYGSDTAWVLEVIEDSFPRDCTFNVDVLRQWFRYVFSILDGAYSCILLVHGVGMFAFRDPRGIRPLSMHIDSCGGVLFASESCAVNASDAIDVAPGHVVWIEPDGTFHQIQVMAETRLSEPCLFEYIYLAHDDSTVDGINVRKARKAMGRLIAPKIRECLPHVDVVVPIPHTPVLSGQVLAQHLGVEFIDVLEVRSKQARRETRTFILPTQTAREQAVRRKFALRESVAERCRDKHVLLLDDSIVRGTTLRHVVSLIRQLGPASISIASLAPPIVSPNRFGIDIPDTSRLVAAQCDEVDRIPQTVAGILGCDNPVVYQELKVLEKELQKMSGRVRGFENSVFRNFR